MSDETPTKPERASAAFNAIDCPLCFHQDLWPSDICPGCNATPESILEHGASRISRFKLPGLYASYPALSTVKTDPPKAPHTWR